jgi:hypothetical protein
MKHACPTIPHSIALHLHPARILPSFAEPHWTNVCLMHIFYAHVHAHFESSSGDPQSLLTSTRCTIPLSLRTSVRQHTTYTTEVSQDTTSRRLHAGHEHRLGRRFNLVRSLAVGNTQLTMQERNGAMRIRRACEGVQRGKDMGQDASSG